MNNLNIEELQLDNDENISCEITIPEKVDLKQVNLDKQIENVSDKNPDDIKDLNLISNIISNDLYNKEVEEDNIGLNEIKLDDMNFKKVNINDIKIDELNLDDIDEDEDLENAKKELVEEKDLQVIKPKEDNIKRIVIEDDRNNLKKFVKDKNKSFRFFD